MNILDEIVAHKRKELAALRTSRPADALKREALARAAPPDFEAALRAVPMGLVAEVKRRSPSAGVVREPFDAAAIARAYEAAGTRAISVLMDRKYFGGGEEDFRAVRAAVALPLLYKEFVVDEWQVWHAASLGASAVLLIAAVLGPSELAALLDACGAARLAALVEVHDEADLLRLAGLDVRCIGVNNRDLKTFQVSLETTVRLIPLAPPGCLFVSESGIATADDVARARSAGAHAVLVGESLLRQADLVAAVKALMP